MRFPRIVLGAMLVLLSLPALDAVELRMQARTRFGHPVVDCQAVNLDEAALLRNLDDGRTVRFSWIFRIGGSDTGIIRYAHRDSLSSGYLVYGEAPETASGPYSREELPEALSTLEARSLDGLGLWGPDEVLEGRLFIDYNLSVPPLSMMGIFSGSRDRSVRYTLSHASAGME